jgi:hypothetical protein
VENTPPPNILDKNSPNRIGLSSSEKNIGLIVVVKIKLNI